MFEMKFSGFNVNRSITYSEQLPSDFYPKENYLIRALLFNRLKNSNSFVLVVGKPRTGKSAFALKMCERIAYLEKKKFDVDNQLTFDDIRKFLMWSQSAKNSEFILDETGTSLNPSAFWSLEQRIMNKFCQTQGFRCNIVFWVLPLIQFLQKNFRFMTDYGVRTFRRRQGVVSLHKIYVDELLGKGGVYPMFITLSYKLPSPALWKHYNDLKKEWNDRQLVNDIDYLDMISKPDTRALLREKNLELTVKLKEQQLERMKEPKKELPLWTQ